MQFEPSKEYVLKCFDKARQRTNIFELTNIFDVIEMRTNATKSARNCDNLNNFSTSWKNGDVKISIAKLKIYGREELIKHF